MRARRAAAVLFAVLALAGCASIPTSGPVQIGTVDDQGGSGDLSLTPVGPAPGATQADIVRGFVAAAVGVQHDFAVAREFLAPTLAAKWNARAGVVLHDGTAAVAQASPTEVTLAIDSVGTVSAEGEYRRGAGHLVEHFTLQRIAGQWRITAAPDGIVLPEVYFTRLYSPRALTFFDASYRHVVPDVRWFVTGSGQPEAIVQALAHGPTAALAAPVTATAFPQGAAASVSQRDGVVNVDLSGGTRPDDLAVARLRFQLQESLSQQAVESVTVSVDGAPRPIRAVTLPSQPSASRPMLVRGGVLGVQRGTAFDPVPGLGRAVGALEPVAATVSTGQGIAAVQTGDGIVAVTQKGKRVVDDRSGLIAPSIDQDGWVWSATSDQPGVLRASTPEGRTVEIDAGLAGALQLTSMEVSRDGTRMLLLYQAGDGDRAVVAGIVRQSSGEPVSLTSARFALPVTGDAIAATWADDTSVGVLAQSGNTDTVTVTQVGGRQSSRGQLANAVSLTGGDSQSELVAVLSNRDVWTQASGTWRSLGVMATLAAVQR